MTAIASSGRLVGGVSGSVASAAVTALLIAAAVVLREESFVPAAASEAPGIPVAFIAGRHVGPIARDGGWADGLIAVQVGSAIARTSF